MEPDQIRPAYKPVVICFAGNDGYAIPMCTAIYSLLKNRNRTRCYDILILYTEISTENQKRLLALAEQNEQVTIRLISVDQWKDRLPKEVGHYYTVEAVYRLLLFGEMFVRYDKILYLDCDMVINGDVSELYDTVLNGAEVAGVRSEEFRALSKMKRPVFLDGYPYNVDNYRTDGLKMKHMEDYFNSGVLLFDLQKARERISLEEIFSLLNAHKYTYYDQDVLNMLFDGRVLTLDCTWNYMTCIEEHLQSGNANNERLYCDLKREHPKIIHYVGSTKPWKCEKILGKYYWDYYKKMEEEYEKKDLPI
ncbi:MAG: hypothetical protein BHV88_15310 [Clostridiales bacterium 41_12_two_minus]|nr:MAG: hypothetical protein BHV88_15310 [Clostridiales bacterium 41_12_two_minus]